MFPRVVEIAQDGRHLSVKRGFLQVSEHGEAIGQVALDDIAAVVNNAHGTSYSNNLLCALAQRNIPLVVTDQRHAPVAFLTPVQGSYEQGRRMDAQIAASKPMQKQLWAQLVRAKLTAQANVLERIGQPSAPLRALVAKVRSGDPDNREAQGARRYWPLLMGAEFRRDRDAEGANVLLNYGYTILRSATARAIAAAGLHPGLGVHHANARNPMRLSNDLMEPFRPQVDYLVRKMCTQGVSELEPAIKQRLAHIAYAELETSEGKTPLMLCIQRLALSLAQVFMGERKMLDMPESALLVADYGEPD